MRVAFAVLILADRLLLTLDFRDFFIIKNNGGKMLLPYAATSQHPSLHYTVTIFQLAPESAWLYWTMHAQGLISAILLLLGAGWPRLQLVLLYLNMLCFHHHNAMIWDGEDVMFRVWTVLLLFLPAFDTITIYDRFGRTRDRHHDDPSSSTTTTTTTTTPVWPFRLWQLNLCFIYAGAGLGKLASERWWNGTALYHISHAVDFFGGAFTPATIFNRLRPLQIMTWSSLLLECTCWITCWFAPNITVVNMILLHLGIELSMNMHCFEFLSVMGWMVFLVETNVVDEQDDDNENKSNARSKNNTWKRTVINVCLLSVITIAFIDTAPVELLPISSSAFSTRLVVPALEYRARLLKNVIDPCLSPLGLYQGTW